MKNLSIVVPIYNKAKYLEDSLNSLLKNQSSETEILLIDDASRDDSFSIISEFAQKNNHVRVLKNESNAGVSYTRNKGIYEANGEYIGFFDADDSVDDRFYQTLYQTAIKKRKHPDMIVGNLTTSIQNSSFPINKEAILNPYLPFSLQRKKFFYKESLSCCNKIYHRDFLEGKKFPDYINEDIYFHNLVCHTAKKVIENRNVNYYYHTEHSERSLSYFNQPNGNFIEFIEGYNWTLSKVGNQSCLNDSFKKTQCILFQSFLEFCIDWNLPYHEKRKLIGTIVDYCIHLCPEMEAKNFGEIHFIIYLDYLKQKGSQEFTTKELEKKLTLLSKIYPRRK